MEQELIDMNTFIPAKTDGKHLDLEYSVTEESVYKAQQIYEMAALNLLRPYLWHKLAGVATATFSIFEKENSIPVMAEINDHLLIKMLPKDDHDWVIIEDIKHTIIEQADNSVGIKLRACIDPRNTEDKISHFFTDTATSVIIIRRIENVVIISYHGRNEKPNIETGNMLENIRNGVIALGAMIGISNLQWNALIKGLLTHAF